MGTKQTTKHDTNSAKRTHTHTTNRYRNRIEAKGNMNGKLVRRSMVGRSAVVAKSSALRNVRRQCAGTDMSEKLEKSIKEAKDTCEEGTTADCAVAWDEVEELSAEIKHKKDKAKKADPLEEFCEDNPEADECRVYED